MNLAESILSNGAPDALIPFRIVAALALAGVLGLFAFVAHHLQGIERWVRYEGLVPKRTGPRRNVLLMVCVMTVVVSSLLLYLVLAS